MCARRRNTAARVIGIIMRRIITLICLGLCVQAAHGTTVTYNQTTTTPTCSTRQTWCSTNPLSSLGFTRLATIGGSGGSGAAVRVVNKDTEVGIVWIIENPSSWAAGDWEVKINVAALPPPSTPRLEWLEITICHIDRAGAACSNIATLGSVRFGAGVAMTSGTHTQTITGVSGVASPDPTDGIAVVCSFSNDSSPLVDEFFTGRSNQTIKHTFAGGIIFRRRIEDQERGGFVPFVLLGGIRSPGRWRHAA